jgi:hypothetical protein
MATISNQQILDAARSAMLKRLNGDAYESYSDAETEFRGMKLKDLEELIARYESRVASDNGTSFHLAEPFDE